MPDDFVDSTLKTEELKFDDWRIYGHEEWKLLGLKFLKRQEYVKAEVAAKRSLAANLGYGISAVLLMNIYLETNQTEQARGMYELSKRLHPAQHARLFKE